MKRFWIYISILSGILTVGTGITTALGAQNVIAIHVSRWLSVTVLSGMDLLLSLLLVYLVEE